MGAKEDRALSAIDVIIPSRDCRVWQRLVIERLAGAGHDVAVLHADAAPRWPAVTLPLLRWERKLFRRHGTGLAGPVPEIAESRRARRPGLRLDLTGGAAGQADIPTLALLFDGSASDAAVPFALAAGRLPDIAAVLDGSRLIGRAAPMVDKPESTALGMEDVLARAITLALASVRRCLAGETGEELPATAVAAQPLTSAGFVAAYGARALPRLGREAVRRARYRHAHWRIGYRFVDGAGVAETGRLGEGWREIPDAGDRFYADPFPHRSGENDFIFVEDYPHATGKAVISVVRLAADGSAAPPEPILEEPSHLSYPQVFDWRGESWMLPEGSAGGRLTLYRATRYPDRWTAETVLLEGEISDATMLEHSGSWWLFATERDGYGSTSDTMAVFSAPAPDGPWQPHPMNPVVIDRRLARPGGAFITGRNRILLPVQDGTHGYGGGLGLSELLQLDARTVRLSEPKPIAGGGDWPYPKIHTLNRAGRLEVIDGIAAVRR